MFLVSLGELQDTDIIPYNTTTKGIDKQIQRKSELDDKVKLFSLQDIADYRTIKGSSYRYEVLVNWEDGNATWEPV